MAPELLQFCKLASGSSNALSKWFGSVAFSYWVCLGPGLDEPGNVFGLSFCCSDSIQNSGLVWLHICEAVEVRQFSFRTLEGNDHTELTSWRKRANP